MNFVVVLEGGKCYGEKLEQGHGGAAVLDRTATGPNRGVRVDQSHEGSEGASHLATWRKNIPSMRKS